MPADTIISIPVTSFKAVESGVCDIGVLTLLQAGGRAELRDTGPKGVKINKGTGPGRAPMVLQFNVVDANNPNERYTVVGAGMSNNGLTNGGDPGMVDFTLASYNQNTVQFNNRYTRGVQTWELYILVTNSAGTVGIIDPEIDNTDLPA